MKILDCTLRDGGYYTNWDYSEELINKYFNIISKMPIDIVEPGYIGNPYSKDIYKGEFYYLSPTKIEKIRKKLKTKKLALMIDTKDWSSPLYFENIIRKYKKKVDILRFAIDWKQISSQLKYLEIAKSENFFICANLMYGHEIINNSKMNDIYKKINNVSDLIYFVDSYGSILPNELKQIIMDFKNILPNKNFGFHSHNNLEMALSNSIEAINNGANLIDSTITGMGRGAGNLKTELLITFLKSQNRIKKSLNYDILDELLNDFNQLKMQHKWGTSLPYMLSGSHKIPQSKVISFIDSRRYSYSDLIKKNEKKIQNKIKFKNLLSLKNIKKNVILVGGGDSVKKIEIYLKKFIENNKLSIFFSGSKNLYLVNKLKKTTIKMICLGGSDYNKNFSKISKVKNLKYIISDPSIIQNKTNKEIYFTKFKRDISTYKKNSPLCLSLETLMQLKIKNIFIVGFDGYRSSNSNVYLKSLNEENQEIFNFYSKYLNLMSLTSSPYKGIKSLSIFREIVKN